MVILLFVFSLVGWALCLFVFLLHTLLAACFAFRWFGLCGAVVGCFICVCFCCLHLLVALLDGLIRFTG